MNTGGTILSLPYDNYVQHIVEVHLNRQTGAPYWLERDQRLSAEALRRVRNFADFKQYIGFRTMDEQRRFEHDTRFRPIETFIPTSGLQNGRWIWVSQTGGTTGSPKHGCWDSLYWEKVLTFSDEFLDLHGVPRNVNWLFMGPTGPHTTGRLVISIAEYRGGRCFSIDLDPRIVKIFGTEGMLAAYERYVRHIWDQAKSILRYQRI